MPDDILAICALNSQNIDTVMFDELETTCAVDEEDDEDDDDAISFQRTPACKFRTQQHTVAEIKSCSMHQSQELYM